MQYVELGLQGANGVCMSRKSVFLVLFVVALGFESSASASANRGIRGKKAAVSHKAAAVKRSKMVVKPALKRLFSFAPTSIASASPRQQAKMLKRLGDSPALSRLRKVLRGRNANGAKSQVAIWIVKTDATRASGLESGFAMDHTGLVFLYGNKRLPISPRLLSRVDIPAQTIKDAIMAKSKTLQGGAEPTLVPMKKLGFIGRSILLGEFETLSRGGLRMTEHFSLQTPRSIERKKLLERNPDSPSLFGILKDTVIPM